uniref:GH16 domain-containing protein n=1 Tax=Globisporangium ultimum (strain ATCC 200006 / CBS 805.95 / DAOM BR144) TaxID=431595 RepID=K3X0I5_GLOUD
MTRLLLSLALVAACATAATVYEAKSQTRQWVDPATPTDRWTSTSSRGRVWELVMSDEFNTPGRSFKPGQDHLWTSLEKPDGVNGALEIYSHNMTSTACDDDGICYFYIKVIEDEQDVRVFNLHRHPPAYETAHFYYRSAMVQSWNKFCFQGGMLEVRAQLPGAVSNASGNPDVKLGKNGPATSNQFYPTWPGIWMMGNLGRAIFSASTNRMWPFSYNKCEPEVFEPSNQRISACNTNPKFGLNPHQGRGAPEIDLFEGNGKLISASMQIAPGMPNDFRLFQASVDFDAAKMYCVYFSDCKTPGANLVDVPTAFYMGKRGHKSWYQGLRYAPNRFCTTGARKQSYATVAASLKTGITENACTPETCPASLDVNSDLGLIGGVGSDHWGINSNGTCYPTMNSYLGVYLCDPDNTNENCARPRNASTTPSGLMKPFNYQMDAISANWPIHMAGYLDYLVYQMEWVTGKNGYVRWMLDGHPLFEITANAFSKVPQDAAKSNPEKIMIEEPMYLILNVALSSSWGAKPPHVDSKCRGDGKDAEANRICNDLPMYMKIDYIRLYQDQGSDLDEDNLMQIGCDPASHPTREWILGHIDEYQDIDNPAVDVAGRAFCKVDADCTVDRVKTTVLKTGTCVKKRCSCMYPRSWGGPRCTVASTEVESANSSGTFATGIYGPPMMLAVIVGGATVLVTVVAVWLSIQSTSRQLGAIMKSSKENMGAGRNTSPLHDAIVDLPQHQQYPEYLERQPMQRHSKANYSQNFV